MKSTGLGKSQKLKRMETKVFAEENYNNKFNLDALLLSTVGMFEYINNSS